MFNQDLVSLHCNHTNLSDCVQPELGKPTLLTQLSDCVQPGLDKLTLLSQLSDCVQPGFGKPRVVT